MYNPGANKNVNLLSTFFDQAGCNVSLPLEEFNFFLAMGLMLEMGKNWKKCALRVGFEHMTFDNEPDDLASEQ